MDDPNKIIVIIKLTLIVIFGFILPQLLAVVGYIKVKNKRRRLKVSALLIAPLTFFVLSMLYWIPQAQSIQENARFIQDPFSVTAGLPTILGTIFHLLLGILIFMAIIFLQYLNGIRCRVYSRKTMENKKPKPAFKAEMDNSS